MILPNRSVKQYSVDLSSDRSIENEEQPDGFTNKRLKQDENEALTSSKRPSSNLREQIRALRERTEQGLPRKRVEEIEDNEILTNDRSLRRELQSEKRAENVDNITPVVEPSETESEEESANDIGQNESGKERHRHRKRGRPVGSKTKTAGRKRRSGAQYTDDDVLKMAKAWVEVSQMGIMRGCTFWEEISKICERRYKLIRSW